MLPALAIVLCAHAALAQGPSDGARTLDSLRTVLSHHSAHDTARVRLLNSVAVTWSTMNPDSGLAYSTRALALARDLRFVPGIAQSLRIGGSCYWRMDQHAQAMDMYLQSISIYEADNDSSGIADVLNLMGIVHMNQNDLDRAQQLFSRSIAIRRNIGPEVSLAPMLINSGIVLSKLRRYNEALSTMKQGLDIGLRYRSPRYVAAAHLELGRTFVAAGRAREAESHLIAARRDAEQTGDLGTLLLTYNALAGYYRATGRHDSALVCAQRALDMSYPLNSIYSRLESYDELALASAALGRYQDAYQYALKHAGIHDTLHETRELKRTSELESQYKFERMSRLREQQEVARYEKQTAEFRLRNTIMWGSLVALALTLVTALALYRLYSSRKRSNDEIEQQKDAIEDALRQLVVTEVGLRRANEAKDRLFAIIAHDLRGPIGSLRGMTELLSDPSTDITEEERRNLLRHMHTSTSQTYELLDNLLSWSLEQRGETRPSPVTVDLSAVIHTTVKLLAMQVSAKKLSLVHDVPEGLRIFADERMVTAVVRNLVSNSIKYTHAGGLIEVHARRRENCIEVRIRDSGTGMSQELIARIINGDPLDSATGTAGETGTGLGLHICHEFVTRNRGTFEIRSEPGRGSEFIVCFPAHDGFIDPHPETAPTI